MEKRIGNIIATWITRKASGFPVSDAQTGFRAFTRDSALQAVNHNLKRVEIPVNFRKREGTSRMQKEHILQY